MYPATRTHRDKISDTILHRFLPMYLRQYCTIRRRVTRCLFRHTHRNRSAYAQVSAAPRWNPRIPARAGLAHAQSGSALKVHRTFIHYRPHGFAVFARLCRAETAAYDSCKNLEIAPLFLQFLQDHLTKNSFVCRPPNYAVLP